MRKKVGFVNANESGGREYSVYLLVRRARMTTFEGQGGVKSDVKVFSRGNQTVVCGILSIELFAISPFNEHIN